MGKHTIRITGRGIHGLPTADNPTGEYPIGHEFETDADLPLGWVGRAVIVGDEPAEGSVFVTGNDDDDSEAGKARREIIEKAEAEFERLRSQHTDETRALSARAEKAEADLQKANEQIDALNLKLKAFDHDGNGEPGGSAIGAREAATAADITAAVALLDVKNDDHWTAAGLPAVDAVAEIAGKPVSRAAITEAAPDAKRPTD